MSVERLTSKEIDNLYQQGFVYVNKQGDLYVRNGNALQRIAYRKPKSLIALGGVATLISGWVGYLSPSVIPVPGIDNLTTQSSSRTLGGDRHTEVDESIPAPIYSPKEPIVSESTPRYFQDSSKPSATTDTTQEATPDKAKECLATWPNKDLVGQRLMIDYPTDPEVLKHYKDLIDRRLLGGVIVMEEVRAEDIQDLQDLNELPLAVATDNESGNVQRFIKGLPALPTGPEAVNMGPKKYRRLVNYHYNELAKRGVNQVFAPVADVAPKTGVHPIDKDNADRTFSNDPDVVTKFSEIQAMAAIKAGITPYIKHFPGGMSEHTDYDSAVTPPINKMEKDLLPFESIAAFFGSTESPTQQIGVMIGNQAITGLTNNIPASLSPEAYSLAKSTGFNNRITITDALNAEAIQNYNNNLPETVVQAWLAGADTALTLIDPQDGPVDTQINNILKAGREAIQDGRLDIKATAATVYKLLAAKGMSDEDIIRTCSG